MAELLTLNAEALSNIDWVNRLWQHPIQRLFWIYQVPLSGRRGGHYHPAGQMLLQCPVGSVEVYVQTPWMDQRFNLNIPTQFLWLKPEDWRLMYNFSADARLLVMASEVFSTMLYIEHPYRPIPPKFENVWGSILNDSMVQS
jgi:hypothetical protein